MYNFGRGILYIVLTIVSIFHRKTRRFIAKRLFQNIDLRNSEYYWVHCASVGEVNLSEKLVRGLGRDTRVLVTMMTDTGMETAQNKYGKDNNIDILYFPIDDKRVIKKILSAIRLKKLVIVETEIWPNLIRQCSKVAGVSMVNGRISDKSYNSYKKISRYLKGLFNEIDSFMMQTKEDRERIISLGADESRVKNIGNLKFDIELEDFTIEKIASIKKELKLVDKKIIVAGSTRDDEEEYILKAFDSVKNRYILILVPRHIERSSDICDRLLEGKYRYSRWSELKDGIREGDEVLLVDSIGVLRKLYAICDIAYVGGTLVNIGGHSLLEPLYYKKAPIFGPYLQNVKEISREVLKREIGYRVEDSDGIVESIGKIENGDVDVNRIEKFFKENDHVSEKALKELLT